MQSNAIEALKIYYNNLDEEGKAKFRAETGLKDLFSISIMSPEFAQKLCALCKININNIALTTKESIWARSKEADAQAAISEEAYDIAVAAEREAEKAQEAAEKYLEKMVASYDEGDYHITEAKNKLRDLMIGTSDATLKREIAGERMVSDSTMSLRAFQSGMIADAMLGQSFNKRT